MLHAAGRPFPEFTICRCRALSPHVDYLRVAIRLRVRLLSDYHVTEVHEHAFYVLYNAAHTGVLALQDGQGWDLHWVLSTACQPQDQASIVAALRQTVLPHLFRNRANQRISVERGLLCTPLFLASQQVAEQLGFVPQYQSADEAEYQLAKQDFLGS